MSEQPAPSAAAPSSDSGVSVLERARRTPMAPAALTLGVALVVGLLLSLLVPDEPGALALIVLGAAVAAATGFTLRSLVADARLGTLAVAGVAAALGVHLMAVTGSLQGGPEILERLGGSGVGFNEALLGALSTPPFSAGTLLAALVAALIVGWGRPRSA